MRYLIVAVAAVGLLLSLLVHLQTYAGIDVGANHPAVWTLHAGCLLVALPMVGSAWLNQGFKPSWRDMYPRWARVVLVMAGAYAAVNFLLFLFLSEGAHADIRDGRYVLHRHGTIVRELSTADYHRHMAYVLRGFSGHWMLFYLAAGLYFLRPAGRV
jgi:hypothetical protein